MFLNVVSRVWFNLTNNEFERPDKADRLVSSFPLPGQLFRGLKDRFDGPTTT